MESSSFSRSFSELHKNVPNSEAYALSNKQTRKSSLNSNERQNCSINFNENKLCETMKKNLIINLRTNYLTDTVEKKEKYGTFLFT